MNSIFKLILTINATSLLVVVYLVKEGIHPQISVLLGEDVLALALRTAAYLTYMAVPIIMTLAIIVAAKKLPHDSFRAGEIEEVEYANNSFLPSYLGYFFVALSIPNTETLLFVYFVLFAFTFMSQALYFNPMFLIFGYTFYNVKSKSGVVMFLISKTKYRKPDEIVIEKTYRINNHTFLEG